MAPTQSTAVGVTPQIIDDSKLQHLLEKLNEFEPKRQSELNQISSKDKVIAPLDIEKLVAVIEPHQSWAFEEQVDLHEWITPLNAVDACLAYFIQNYPSLLLIGPVKRKRGRGMGDSQLQFLSRPADSRDDVASVPAEVVSSLKVFLRFLSSLLRNSSSKSVFNSVEELVDLLAAADDSISALALEALCNLAVPPSLHKQQSPEVNQHSTALHTSKTASHRRLIAMARGWGTRGSGLGLYNCVTADDSDFGQGSLPTRAGEIDFSFSTNVTDDSKNSENNIQSSEATPSNSDYQLVRITLTANEIVDGSEKSTNDDVDMADVEGDKLEASNKRRRVGPVGSKAKKTKSTAELFFMCLEKAGGRSKIQDDRLFALLADIRLAKSFYSSATRVEAVERRLRALITVLHAHPSQEVMSGYFQAQPELCVELIDLLRPTVSSANVSAASSSPPDSKPEAKPSIHKTDALGALASSPTVPYGVRLLAIDALTALVARRDGTTGALTGTARHSSVLNELGVGKGQYLGLLPTLIRYSLASLGSSLSTETDDNRVYAESDSGEAIEAEALDIGLAFVEATRPPVAPRLTQIERALEFIDSVLTLTSAIVSTPTGTSALTDCGLVPALLATASIDSQSFIMAVLPDSSTYEPEDLLRVQSLLRFITAQAIQILEGAVVTHNNALAAFHDLHGVEVLTSRLSKEVGETSVHQAKADSTGEMDCDAVPEPMETDEPKNRTSGSCKIQSSQRVLLFSIVTCLTVVFHQESTSATAAAPSGGAQLRKPELTRALIDIMDGVSCYGGHLVSLVATLLSDVLNSDPHVVHHVHKSGIAATFLKMLGGIKTTSATGTVTYEPTLPPVPELIMALPNVISALALTEDGAKAVKEANPFPAMLRLLHHPNYAMPKSRCLLNEMTAIVGTGLDEVMRHVQILKPLVLSAVAGALNEIVVYANDLVKLEESTPDGNDLAGQPSTELENSRSCLMQYVLNFGQLLEQILHNEDHCEPFVAAGGLDALLKLFPVVMPSGYQFLAHVSSLSCPSVSTLHHSTAEESLSLAYKCIALRYDPLKLIKTTVDVVNVHVKGLEKSQSDLRKLTSSSAADDVVRIDAAFVLEGLPCKALHHLSRKNDSALLDALSTYLRAVANVQWATSLLSVAIKTACQRNQDRTPGFNNRSEREWKKEVASSSFQELVGKLSTFHQSSIFEVCRIRSTEEFERRERERMDSEYTKKEATRYRLRIVCPEGAVVRDGIEIDSCASVGSMEMGEVADAFDRCINSSGILRYRTRRGWVSEMTRGHGREPVAEVIDFWQSAGDDKMIAAEFISTNPNKRIEATIPDICTVSVNVLARLQTSFSELLNSVSKAVVQSVRSLTSTSISFQEGETGAYASTMMKVLASAVQEALDRGTVPDERQAASKDVGPKGIAMYLGCILTYLQGCLFEEKRERRMVNVPLLLLLMESDCPEKDQPSSSVSHLRLLDAVDFIFDQSLTDYKVRSESEGQEANGRPLQAVDRTVAASIPPTIALLRRLMQGQVITSSPACAILSRIKKSDLAKLLGREINASGFKKTDDDEALFSPEDFVKSMHFSVSSVVRKSWVDPRLVFAPPHILHPYTTLVGDIIGALEDAGKKKSTQTRTPRAAADSASHWDFLGVRRREGNNTQAAGGAAGAAAAAAEDVFEPSEESIARLVEMGFTRDHAIDALENAQSNRVEIAMEYALSHPPPSPAAIERRRQQREERRRRREEAQNQASSQNNNNNADTSAGAAADGSPAQPGLGSSAASDGNAPAEAAALAAQGAARNDDTVEPMDVENNGQAAASENKESSEETKEKKEKNTEEDENDAVATAKKFLREWVNDAQKVSCNILANVPTKTGDAFNTVDATNSVEKGQGDGEKEALAVVLCSFLLDICQRYPEECNNIVIEVLRLIKSQIASVSDEAFQVATGKEASFSALCHATVLFTRALPKTRILVLKENLTHMIVSCVQSTLSAKSAHKWWPVWLPSALLLLDVMAQPVVQFADKQSLTNEDENTDADTDTKNEFSTVRGDHKKQVSDLKEMATRVFSAVGKEAPLVAADSTKNRKKVDPKSENASSSPGAEAESDKKEGPSTLFADIPAFYPLLPSNLVDSCLEVCLDLLRKGRDATEDKAVPPPGVVHATMLFMLRLLRTPKIAARCLQMGTADIILSLPHKCRFTGNSGLVTLILRRLLEDEQTLQSAMETEIRSTIAKLHGKRREAETEKLSAPHGAFIQSVTPLLCRDPISFLKAFIMTLKIEPKGGESVVTLLSQEERSRNQRALADVFKVKKQSSVPTATFNKPSRRRSSSLPRHKKGTGAVGKSKSPPARQSSSKRSHSSKKHKREKEEKQSAHPNHLSQLNASPAAHVVSLLISHILSSCASSSEDRDGLTYQFQDDKSFLWTANLLEILADLVLAVPACASAVQKCRSLKSRDRSRSGVSDTVVHALIGCPHPPKTFLSFLLHNILPQDRWSIRNDQDIWDRSKEETEEPNFVKEKKKMAFRLSKVSQSAARLLVALVARPGEGRKRVISELTFALSGGLLGHPTSSTSSLSLAKNTEEPRSAKELHALQAWGELCIGLASPRSSGKNPEGISSLSIEVIRLMLELGMAHALLFSIHRVRLHHPMAASTCSSLLLPFEVLTRGSVADGVKTLLDKENTAKSTKEGGETKKANEESTAGGGIEGSDEAMLEEAFHHEVEPSQPAHNVEHDDFEENEMEQAVAEDEEDVEMEEDGEGEDDEEISSSSDSEGSSSDEENSDDDDSDGDEDDDDDEGSILDDDDDSGADSSEEMEAVEANDWDNIGYREEMAIDNQDFDDGEENELERNDTGLDEGWTRIEASGFGGMLMGAGGGRRHGLAANGGPLTARTRGFIDAAEAMIGTLLRSGELHDDTLAELEGSLGIRIVANGRSLRGLGGAPEGADDVFAESIAQRLGARMGGSIENRQPSSSRARSEVVGTLPHVHQRNQPGAGYSALSSGGRWIETSSMEFVFGGPSVTAGSRNYDLYSPSQLEAASETQQNLTQLDLQLFPGGPASAAHARTQHSLHPLLCGVDLPPINALVSDLLPHGTRCTRRGQMTTRRPGEWTNSSFASGNSLVLTSNGNVIRSSRSHAGGPLSLSPSPRGGAGPVGWTDDGLPFDPTASQFSSAFDTALRGAMQELDRAREDSAGNDTSGTQRGAPSRTNGASENAENATGGAAAGSGGTQGEAENDAADLAPSNDEESPTAEESNVAQGSEDASSPQMNASTDGDRVASSLAEGLRLSPRRDNSAEEQPASGSTNDAHMQESAAADTSMDDAPENATDADAAMEDAEGEAEPEAAENGTAEETSATDDQPQNQNADDEPSQALNAENAIDGEENQNEASDEPASGGDGQAEQGQANAEQLVCPPGVDEEIFNQLPIEMQRECIEQHNETQQLAAQLDAGSSLDPEALAALPEDLRREVMQQEQQERRLREQAPADPSNAEEMDNASFLASLTQDLREEILLTADDNFLQSLPPGIIAEAQVVRERAASQQRRIYEESAVPNVGHAGHIAAAAHIHRGHGAGHVGGSGGTSSNKRKSRTGKLKVDRDRKEVVFLPQASGLTPPISKSDLTALLRLLYMLAPVRPARLLQKVFQNFCANKDLRRILSTVFVKLLHEDDTGAQAAIDSLSHTYGKESEWRQMMDKMSTDMEFPPKVLLGAVPEVLDTESFNPSIASLRRKSGNNTAASIAANLPTSSAGSRNEQHLPPVVATRIVEVLYHLCKNSQRCCLHSLVAGTGQKDGDETVTVFDGLLDLLSKPRILKSSANLEQVLTLLEQCVTPLSHLAKESEEKAELSQRDIDAAASSGKEWMDVPRVTVSQHRLQLLCSILRMETCRDASFTKVNTIVRRLCRVEENRGYVLAELASVAHALGSDAIRDLKALRIRLDGAVAQQKASQKLPDGTDGEDGKRQTRSASSSVTLSTSTSELKLLRVLQTLQALCGDNSDDQAKKNEIGVVVTEELVHLLRAMKLEDLWDELTECLKVVQVLEGVSSFKDDEDQKSGEGESNDEASGDEAVAAAVPGKKLKNSAAGLLTRFLPSIEAFFVANASSTREATPEKEKGETNEDAGEMETEIGTAIGKAQNQSSMLGIDDSGLEKLVGGRRLVQFAAANKVLLNALIRNNPSLLEKGFRGLVQVPRCRVFLDFDVKRQWFKTQVRRLRQHASRRHGSVRLHIRRKHVFEDAYHQLRLRNADEMRGRLHITFRNEEGVDAGGLSREFFGILAKEMFNPNYALFTSTEDGCTFQPNANSSINPDHLSYFRFVGRIVGKAVADGFLLDAHFTRSLYKHMLGLKPTHHDMEAIDPDYYKNLKTILEYKLEDIGLDLTFSIEDHSFGRSQVIDLKPDGKNIVVTEENKAEYVSLVCQHRMTMAISSQIKSYLDGFYEMVSPDLIAIFNPRELELLISGLPDIDVHDLKKNTDYVGWKATDKEIQWFWNVLFNLSRNEKAAFLQFVTGSSKVPLAGFSELQGMRGVQKFSIHKTSGPGGALMSAHTCFNSLDLPTYKSEDELREKLVYAINEGVGAFLFA